MESTPTALLLRSLKELWVRIRLTWLALYGSWIKSHLKRDGVGNLDAHHLRIPSKNIRLHALLQVLGPVILTDRAATDETLAKLDGKAHSLENELTPKDVLQRILHWHIEIITSCMRSTINHSNLGMSQREHVP